MGGFEAKQAALRDQAIEKIGHGFGDVKQQFAEKSVEREAEILSQSQEVRGLGDGVLEKTGESQEAISDKANQGLWETASDQLYSAKAIKKLGNIYNKWFGDE